GAGRNRLNFPGPCALLINRAEKGHSSARIMLPTVFAVQDDGNQGRLGAVDRLANGSQAHDKIVGRGRRIPPLIMKPDQVAQGMIAKDDAELASDLTDL